MIVYAESSAVLSWLLGEAEGDSVRQVLASAEAVVTSELTLIESERCLIRARVVDGLSEASSTERREQLEQVVAHWTLLTIGPEVVERACTAFPVEPIRTLDALHLATVITAGAAVSGLTVLSLDGGVRNNAAKLGFDVLPTLTRDTQEHDSA